MKIVGFLIIGMNVVMASPLRADPVVVSGRDQTQDSAYLKKHEKNLERMQANRSLDNEHTRLAKEEFRKGTAELSGHDEKQLKDVQDLKSVENQIASGQQQKVLAHQSYKEAEQKYGTDDPRSEAAKESWKESKKAMVPLLQDRQTLKKDIHQGGRQVHNAITVLSVQKRDMDSDARYRVQDDRAIRKEEKIVANEQKAMTQNVQSFGPVNPK